MDIVQHIATAILFGLGLSLAHAIITLVIAMLEPRWGYAALTVFGAICYLAGG